MTTFLIGLSAGTWMVPADHELYDSADGRHRSLGVTPVGELAVTWAPHDIVHVDLAGSYGRLWGANLVGFSPQVSLGYTLTAYEIRPALDLGVTRMQIIDPFLGSDADWGRHGGLSVAAPVNDTLGAEIDWRRTRMSAVGDGFTHHHLLTAGVTWTPGGNR